MKFVYVTPGLRMALNRSSDEEQEKIAFCGQPSYSFVNNKTEQTNYTFEMDNSFYDSPPYEFNDAINKKPFSELMYDRALQLRLMDKEIDVYKETLILQYLREAGCPEDQIHLIEEDKPLKLDTRILVTGLEYRLLFEGLNNRWRERVDNFLLSISWQVLNRWDGIKFDIKHYQPFFLEPSFEKWAINKHIEKKTSKTYYIDPPKYRSGDVLGILSDGTVIFKRTGRVKENNLCLLDKL
jgi:hypothetical protein|tara:strand:+ start:947 stop:1663 length:717 start_codon:yes stop_codon:yes gene_type:complete